MEDKKVGFNLLVLKTDQFAAFEESFSEKEEKYSLVTGLKFKINKERKQVGVFATFTFEQDKKAFLKIQISCHFGIDPTSWDRFCKDSKIVFPKGFITHLAVLTVGSARGVLHAKTEGTKFNKFLLPAIDLTNMRKVEFPLF